MKQTNKLLADFLELKTTDFNSNLYLANTDHFDLEDSVLWNPRLDWNQLMLVIKKILTVSLDSDSMEQYYDITDAIPSLNTTYEECMNFVKLYNQTKNGKNFNQKN